MIRDPKWRWGFVLGALVALWVGSFPFLAQAGILPITLSPANIGAGFLIVAPYWLTLGLMALFALIQGVRHFSFGLAIPLVALQIGIVVRATIVSPLVLIATLIFSLPSLLALLLVGVVYYVTWVRRSRERPNTLEPLPAQEP